MDTTIKVAIIVAISALITAIITNFLAPRINWGLEKKKDRLRKQHELIEQWRSMIEELMQYYISFTNPDKEGNLLQPQDWLKGEKRFYSLKPYLSKESFERIDSGDMYGLVDVLIEEVSRIESEWELVPNPKKRKPTREENRELKELSAHVNRLSSRSVEQEKALQELQSKVVDNPNK
jgi:hypothetical protein